MRIPNRRYLLVAVFAFVLVNLWTGSAHAGGEVELVQHLRDAAVGAPARAGDWQKPVSLEALLSGAGSQNIPLLALAVRYVRGLPDARPALLQVLDREQTEFMGTEWRSSIYGYWVACAWGTVAHEAHKRGDTEIYTRAVTWLRYYVALDTLLAAPAPCGPGLVAGDRSAGHTPLPGWPEYIRGLAIGCDPGTLRGWLKAAGLAPNGKGRWTTETVAAIADELATAGQPLREGSSPLAVLRAIGWTQKISATYIETTGGAIVVRAGNANSNTPPIWASRWIAAGNRFDSIPAEGGHRIRQKADTGKSSIDRAARTVVVESSLYGRHVMEFSPGEVRTEIYLPGSGERWMPDAVPVPDVLSPPTSTPPEAPAPTDPAIESIITRVRDLGGQPEPTSAIEVALRSNDSTACELLARLLVARKFQNQKRVLLVDLRCLLSP